MKRHTVQGPLVDYWMEGAEFTAALATVKATYNSNTVYATKLTVQQEASGKKMNVFIALAPQML